MKHKKTNRHAYLIIAHNEFDILEKQIKLIDDIRNDIYIHIDKKVNNFDFSYYLDLPKYSNVYFIKRICVYWGDYSIVQVELNLFEASIKGDYDYFHLISGVDLLIKSQNQIHTEIDNGNKFEYIDFGTKEQAKDRMKYVSCIYNHKPKNTLFGACFSFWNKIRCKLRLPQIPTKWDKDKELCFGSQWCSVTKEFVEYVLQNKKWIKKHFRFSHVPDELFIHTLAYNSRFKDRIHDAKRYIDWYRGSPYVFRSEDFDSIVNSDCFFARKFCSQIDNNIIQQLYSFVLLQDKD